MSNVKRIIYGYYAACTRGKYIITTLLNISTKFGLYDQVYVRGLRK